MEQTNEFLFIALELCMASLSDYIEGLKLKQEEMMKLETELPSKQILSEITKGIQHLHEMKFVHRDIKPHNVFNHLNIGLDCSNIFRL